MGNNESERIMLTGISQTSPENLRESIDLGTITKMVESTGSKKYNDIFYMIKRVATEPPVQYVWSGIKKGTFGYIYGPAKSGKTILGENLGMSIAAKKDEYLGMPINHTGIEIVLFVSLEEFWINRSERNRKQILVLQLDDPENFKYFVVNELFPVSMDDEKNWIDLEAAIRDSKAEFVIIDSFTRLSIDEVEKSKVSSEISRKLKKLTNDLGITLAVIHHSFKMTDSTLDLANMAGSRVVGQEADFILGVNRLSNGTRYFKEVATRYKQESEYVTTFSIDDNLWLLPGKTCDETQLFTSVDHRENPFNEELVFMTIKSLIGDGTEVKTKDLVTALNGKLSQTVIYGYLVSLEQKMKIDRSKKGYIKI
jgi:KaiC/GvpD/RAD55 family RecA-like ATPase